MMTSIGISQVCPEIAYDHIQNGGPLAGENEVFQLVRFVEKHGCEVAPACFDSSDLLWRCDWFAMRLSGRVDVNAGARFTVKRISGTVPVTKGGETFPISKKPSTCISLDVTHRLENPGIVPLKIIEVPSGDYPGEDDVVRFDTTYRQNRR